MSALLLSRCRGQALGDLCGLGGRAVRGGAPSCLTVRGGGVVTACQSRGLLGNGSEATGSPRNPEFLGLSVLTPSCWLKFARFYPSFLLGFAFPVEKTVFVLKTLGSYSKQLAGRWS